MRVVTLGDQTSIFLPKMLLCTYDLTSRDQKMLEINLVCRIWLAILGKMKLENLFAFKGFS